MIHLKRRRDVASLKKDFTGEGLVKKLVLLVNAKIASDDIAWTGKLGDWKKMKPTLQKESFNKCAYCESNTASVAHGDVEHFRPKSVYWWLAFCVDNYVFACQLCNQTYKKTFFPIHGKTLRGPKVPSALPAGEAALKKFIASVCPDPAGASEEKLLAEWLVEDADLPHPYLEDPERLFAWKVVETNEEVLLVAPARASPRAKRAVAAAVEYLGLNREPLTGNRYAVYAAFAAFLQFWKISNVPKAKSIALEQMKFMCRPDQQFAGMCRHFARLGGVPWDS